VGGKSLSAQSVGGKSLLAQQMNQNGLIFENNSTRLNQMVSSHNDRSLNKSMRSAKPRDQSSPKDPSKTTKDINSLVQQPLIDQNEDLE